ncbi:MULTISPECIES: DUF2497 domain-containing protein [Rhodopseudomonas]|uniref:DUF2497 domain-containing protein n=1 Tax=Rhodopseudomonas palustris TaxID=1076 RepID=A0A0D7EJ54_RHOPL|nr:MULTISPECIES: DUF2497 domain-containing protein [Rhodopseudomonas]KIZ39532.1 hypothetical protein OO17_20225 [Rhodopseudomonas palustris]MDF3813692.1 DUF2497 domain-containing protein [Rhodopseudomonas sp. BAL398]WOK18822.1 DUF2497 domain-containing protein [Rhodopseudomonas sp. BAL398]
MTQPAKVQEPSMEEILASIRRIIADDEAKPAATPPSPVPAAKPEAAKPVAPAPKPAAMSNDAPAAPAPKAAAAPPKPVTAAAKPEPTPPPAPPAKASNDQDDIDALLAGLDATTTEDEVRPPQPDGDVFELTDDMALPDPPTPLPGPSYQKQAIAADLEFAEATPPIQPPREPAFEAPPERAVEAEHWASEPAPQQMLSRSTASAVESAFNSLANTVLSNNARTLEDLVKEMLRPMLKSWLDDNLPTMVERIVKAEIERVSRGR